MVDIQSATTENRRGKKEEETTAAKYNGLPYWEAINISEYNLPIIPTSTDSHSVYKHKTH